MFDILLPEQSEFPLYQQLYLQIREGIRNGAIPDGQRLPSVHCPPASAQYKQNANRDGLSNVNVRRVCDQQTEVGAICHKSIQGTISPSSTADPSITTMSVMHSYGHLNQGVIDFNPTRLDQASFPVRTWNKMLKEALEQHVSEMGMYGDPQGEYGLRTVVSEYLRNSRGLFQLLSKL